INVQVVYPGASPEEVAEGVIIKIEEQLDGLNGVERVTSVSRENSGNVTVEIKYGADIDKVLADVKNAVDGINSFPEGAEKPLIFERKFRTRSLSVVLYGETDLYNLKFIAEEFRDNLLDSPEITQVDISGMPDLEFSIEVSEEDMRRYQLTFDEIASAVSAANINMSGGKFDTDAEEILIRTWGRNYQAGELQDIVVRGNPDGTVVYLKDVADIKEQWEDVPDKIYFNGQTSLILNIDQTEQEDILAIADVAKKEVANFNATHDNIKAEVLDDRTIPLRQRIELLVKNGILGLFLVIAALSFFLNLRMSFWVAVSIPFSFAGMFIIASFAGITINVFSLFGMIIVIGILVDDGIVVGENIFAHFERGSPAKKAAIDGASQMTAPVITSVMTTMIVFMAFFFIQGIMGEFMWQMALVVIASLVFSLIEAFLVLPSHLAHSRALQANRKVSKIREKIEKAINFLTHRMYAPSLRLALKYRWITIVTPAALIMLTVGLVGGGFIRTTFFPNLDSDRVPINITLVAGRQEAATDSILTRIERVCWEVNEELKSERADGRDVILSIKREIGSNDFGESGSHTGSVLCQLLDGEVRDMESHIIANRIREAVGPVPDAEEITFGEGGRFGKAVSVSLLGNDHEQLSKARDLLKAELHNFSSLKDITDTDEEGRREIDISLKPRAYSLGLTLNDVFGQVRQGFYGREIQRIQRGRDEIKVWVRYRPEDRASLGNLDQMRIRTPDGSEYPFGELAEYSIKRGITTISHLDRKQEIRVEANQSNVEEDLPPILAEIETDVLPRVLAQVTGVKAGFEGQSREEGKMVGSMMIVFPMALMGMYILVVLVFRSFGQAFLIFSLIPIGVLGAVWGHGIHAIQVNALSLVGIIALSGVIINDSIVFIDQINRNLRDGQKVFDAVYNTGLARLRPILLTTLTTALGLAPLILETSRQAQFLIPMAISVAYGLLFGTLILLVILPAAFLVFSSIRTRVASLRAGRKLTPEEAEPAVKELKLLSGDQTA
ncbi:MAG TPA: efflux RND transporter permease subunit, partial [candidate division Zixibacteria bacterium]|nr:efflux RND transporter permease subunit [candidate division Zixibacteria bacterium]